MRFLDRREPEPDNRSALEIVCDTADEWAGEYGFSNPPEARRVFAAVDDVRKTYLKGDSE
jgi:hypothetical protein